MKSNTQKKYNNLICNFINNDNFLIIPRVKLNNQYNFWLLGRIIKEDDLILISYLAEIIKATIYSINTLLTITLIRYFY